MLVQDVMIDDVHCIAPDASIAEAAQMMADLDIGALPVEAEGRRVAGIITRGDILIRVVAQGRDPQTTRVADAMSADLFTCTPEDPVEDAIRAMEEHQVRRMPVLDGEGRMVGLVTLADLRGASQDGRAGVVAAPG
jgi:CBS domain-containing protein